MAGKSIEERIRLREQRMADLEHDIRLLKGQMESREERKARTHRLIQIGSVMAALGFDLVAVQELQRDAESRPEVRQYLDDLIAAAKARAEQSQE